MSLFAYCLPLIVAAVLVFIASSLIHMVFKWHSADYLRFSNEDEIRDAIRKGSPAPGQYQLPYCAGMKDIETPDMQKKFIDGPVGLLLLRASGRPGMGPLLGQWLCLNLLVAGIATQLTAMALPVSADRHLVFHTTALITFIAYAGGSISDGIWKGQPWKTVAKDVVDALVFGVVSGVAFAWLWPR